MSSLAPAKITGDTGWCTGGFQLHFRRCYWINLTLSSPCRAKPRYLQYPGMNLVRPGHFVLNIYNICFFIFSHGSFCEKTLVLGFLLQGLWCQTLWGLISFVSSLILQTVPFITEDKLSLSWQLFKPFPDFATVADALNPLQNPKSLPHDSQLKCNLDINKICTEGHSVRFW